MSEKADVQVDTNERIQPKLNVALALPSVNLEQQTRSAGTEIKGHLFESKLLTLFLVRAISSGYQFELAVNKEDIGGKFDDLIYRYKTQNNKLEGDEQNWTYRYLQAKHKGDKTKFEISADSLLSGSVSKVEENNKNDKDYSLIKYFQSYSEIKARGDNIQDCIICTNINFKSKEMKGIQLKPVDINCESILNFETHYNQSLKEDKASLFKLELPEDMMTKLLIALWESSDLNILVMQLQSCIVDRTIAPSLTKIDIFGEYHIALLNEKIFEIYDEKPKMLRFHQDFIQKNFNALSPNAQLLREKISAHVNDMERWKFQCSGKFGKSSSSKIEKQTLPNFATYNDIKNFLDKLIFAVNMPSEDQLDAIISCDVNKYYNKDETESQTIRILNQILNWFKSAKNKQSEWLSSKIGKQILLEGVTKHSIEYRNQLMSELGFNENSVENMKMKLKLIFGNSNEKSIFISTRYPKWTAAKVISALENLPEYKTTAEDTYWVTPLSCILNENVKELWENRLNLVKNDIRHLVIIVDEDNSNATTIPDYSMWRKKMIFVNNSNHEESIKDDFTFEDLDDETKRRILSRRLSFQGKDMAVGELLHSSETNVVINNVSIEELMDDKKPNNVSAFNFSGVDQSLYIERKLAFVSDDFLFRELAIELDCTTEELEKECTFDSKGEIKWLVKDDNQKTKIWERFKTILECKTYSTDLAPTKMISEHELLSSTRVIITGVAGTGKSTMLSNYYEKIKSKRPDWWVMKLNLVDHSKYLLNSEAEHFDDPVKAIEFLINNEQSMSSFARSLLTHRLKTGKRIVLMLDGFDEIDDECQDVVIKLIKSFKKSIQLYVTTRPHITDKLQSELLQQAYSLIKFDEQDQMEYLTSIWGTKLRLNLTEFTRRKAIQDFATKLMKQASLTLNDQERDFIGIPLQCRILAECFQSKVQEIIQLCTENIETVPHDLSKFIEDQHFDLASLYRLLMQTKRQVFCEEKMKLNTDNLFAKYSIEITIKQLEFHLTKLAIKTIFTMKEDAAVLCPDAEFELHRYRSEKSRKEEEKLLDELGISFGLLDRNKEGRMRFLHKTYSEYLVADYIYQGLLLDNKSYNNLLERTETRNLIVTKILVTDKYRGILVFLDSMLKEIFTRAPSERRRQASNFPDRLQELANLSQKGCLLNKLSRNRHFNIFKFILNCLDATFIPSQVRSVINKPYSPLKNSSATAERIINFHQNNELLIRLLAYYNNDTIDDDEWKEMFIALFNSCITIRKGKVVFTEASSTRKNISFIIDWMKNHRTRFISLAVNRDEKSKKAINVFVKFLTHDPEWNYHLQEFCKILSSFYPEDSSFLVELLEDAITFHYRNPRRNQSKTSSLTVSDCLGMTPLYLKDLYVDIETSKQILSSYLLPLTSEISTLKKESSLISCSTDNDMMISSSNYHDASLLAVFAICYNEQMNRKISFSINQMNTKTDGCLDLANGRAINSTNLIETLAKNGQKNFYQQLKYLSMYMQYLLKYAQVDTLQGVVASNEFDNWFEQLLQNHHCFLKEALPSVQFVRAISKDCRSYMVEVLVSKHCKSPDNKQSTYWAHLTCNRTKMAIKFMKHTSKILDKDNIKKLLFHKDDNGLVLVQAMMLKKGTNAKEIDKMLLGLPQEMQLEFRRSFTEQGTWQLNHLVFNERQQATRINWKRLTFLQIILKYGNLNEFSRFVEEVTTVPNRINEEEKCSLWDYILNEIKLSNKNEIKNFIQRVLDKLGENAVKDLVLYLDDRGILALRPALVRYIWTVEASCAHMSKEMRNEIRQGVLDTPGMIDKMLEDTTWQKSIRDFYLDLDSKGFAKNILNDFNLLALHFVEKFDLTQLKKFLKAILVVKRTDNRSSRIFYSVWFDYVEKACKDGKQQPRNVESIRKFLKSIHQKLGESYLESLVFHKKNDKSDDISIHAATSGNVQIFEALISQFDEKKQFQIRTNAFTRLTVARNMLDKNGFENMIHFYLITKPNESQNEIKILAGGFDLLIGFFFDIFDGEQLNHFVNQILSTNTFNTCCIWSEYVNKVFPVKKSQIKRTLTETSLQSTSRRRISKEEKYSVKELITITTIKRFLKCVAKHLGKTTIRNLLLYEDANGIIIERVAANKTKHSQELHDIMRNYLINDNSN